MNTINPISRRSFLKTSLVTVGGVLMLTLQPKQASAQVAQILKSTISKNHGHSFGVNLEEFFANGPRVYSIKGLSGHGHNLEITSEILDTLKKTKIVEVESSDDFGHSHIVRLEIA